MSKEMLINVSEGEECRIALVVDGRLEDLYMERTSSTSHVGNIYKGKVTNVEASIQAAFIDFGLGRNGFLHVSDLQPEYFGKKGEDVEEYVGKKMARRDRPPIQRCLRRGDEIIVQVIKEGIGTKGPTLTSYPSISGKMLVMMPGVVGRGVSRKIEDDQERRRLKQILDSLRPPEDCGFIVRTEAFGKSKAEIERDLKYLTRLWDQIKRRRDSHRGPVELYTEGDLITRTIRDHFTADVDHLIVDNEDVADRVREAIRLTTPRAKDRVEAYTGAVPLFHKYGIERDIELMYSRHVPLPSGGSLVIDSTEAIVAIDVNSGKFRDHSDAETTAFKTDMEAADEICRQLKLRDLGGVIICDFIDLRFERHRRALEDRLNENFKNDRAKTKVLPMSQFGIVQITRQRMRPGLKRSVYFDCPHCKGAGLVKTPESMGLDVMRRLAIALNDLKVVRAELGVCTDVAHYLNNYKRRALSELEDLTKKRVVVKVDPAIGLDEMRLDLYDNRDGMVLLPELTDALTTHPHTSQLNVRQPGAGRPGIGTHGGPSGGNGRGENGRGENGRGDHGRAEQGRGEGRGRNRDRDDRDRTEARRGDTPRDADDRHDEVDDRHESSSARRDDRGRRDGRRDRQGRRREHDDDHARDDRARDDHARDDRSEAVEDRDDARDARRDRQSRGDRPRREDRPRRDDRDRRPAPVEDEFDAAPAEAEETPLADDTGEASDNAFGEGEGEGGRRRRRRRRRRRGRGGQADGDIGGTPAEGEVDEAGEPSAEEEPVSDVEPTPAVEDEIEPGDDRGNRRDARGDRGPRRDERAGRRDDRGARGNDRGPRRDDQGSRRDDRGSRRDDRGSRPDDRQGRRDDRGDRQQGRGDRDQQGRDRNDRDRDDRRREQRSRDERPRDERSRDDARSRDDRRGRPGRDVPAVDADEPRDEDLVQGTAAYESGGRIDDLPTDDGAPDTVSDYREADVEADIESDVEADVDAETEAEPEAVEASRDDLSAADDGEVAEVVVEEPVIEADSAGQIVSETVETTSYDAAAPAVEEEPAPAAKPKRTPRKRATKKSAATDAEPKAAKPKRAATSRRRPPKKAADDTTPAE